MSASGGGLEQVITMLERELEDVVHQLDKMGNSVQRAGKRTVSFTDRLRKSAFSSTIGFGIRTGLLTARRFGRAAVMNTLARSMEFGFRGGDTVSQGIVQAAASTPLLGALFQDYAQPKKNATQRASGVLTRIARAGGQVTEDMAARLMMKFAPEEIAARKAEKAVQRASGREEVQEAFKGALEEGTASKFATELALEIGRVLGDLLRDLFG